MMHAITLHQPWATLWISGAKTFETRWWRASIEGERIAVHAAKHWTKEQFLLCYRQPFASALGALGYNAPNDLPLGAILGTLVVQVCVPARVVMRPQMYNITNERLAKAIAENRTNEAAFGDFVDGRFAWFGVDRDCLLHPIPCKGGQGLWFVPRDVEERMRISKSMDELNRLTAGS